MRTLYLQGVLCPKRGTKKKPNSPSDACHVEKVRTLIVYMAHGTRCDYGLHPVYARIAQ